MLKGRSKTIMMIWNGTLQPRLKHRCYFAPLSCGWTSILLEVLNVFQRWCVREFQILLKKGSSIMYYQMHFPFPWLTPRYPGKISKLIFIYVSWILLIGIIRLISNTINFHFSLATMLYLPKYYKTMQPVVENLNKGRDDGLQGYDCEKRYRDCDKLEMSKIHQLYWILPWNPMGNSNVLHSLAHWVFHKTT